MALKEGLTVGQALLSSWNGSGSDPCQWAFVTCDYMDRVSALCAYILQTCLFAPVKQLKPYNMQFRSEKENRCPDSACNGHQASDAKLVHL
jgi:hypothetical protein